MDKEDRMETRTLSGINMLLGAWLIVSPYILSYSSTTAKWNQTIFGVVILLLAVARYIMPRLELASWLAGLAGIWMIIAPFILNYSTAVAYWNEVLVGIVVAMVAFWNTTIHTRPYRTHT